MGKVVGLAAALSSLVALTGCGDGGSTGSGSGADGGVGATAHAGEGSDSGGSTGKGASSNGGGTSIAGSAEQSAGAPAGTMGGADGNAAGAPASEGGTPGTSGGGMPSGEGGAPEGNNGGTANGGTPGMSGGSAHGGAPDTSPSAGAPSGGGGAPDLGECEGQPSGAPCGDPGSSECDAPDTCQRGVCVPNHVDVGVECGDEPINQCDAQSTCDGAGACAVQFQPSGTACGDQQTNTACDKLDSCDGAGSCEPNLTDFGVACGSSVNNECDNPDYCDGDGVCEQAFEIVGTTCGSGANTECDDPDSCDGAGKCSANREPGGTPCGSNADTECSNPDYCNDIGVCEANHAPAGTPCGSESNSDCSAADTCSAGVCAQNHAANGASCEDCSAGIGQCSGCSSGGCTDSALCPLTSYPLSTGYGSNANGQGIMFDMAAEDDLTIRGFDVNLATGTHDVSVYVTTTAWSHAGNDATPANWTLLKTYSGISGTASASATALPRDLEYTLKKGESRGFYITLATSLLQRSIIGTSVGATRVSDGLLTIKEGISKGSGGFAGNVGSPRVFSGSVHYTRSITTALSGGGTMDGVMFDVDAAKDARIRGLQVLAGATGSFDVELWYRNGTHVGHEISQADWTLVDAYAGVPMVAGESLRLPLATDLIFAAGSTHALYVTTEAAGALRAIVGTGVGTVVKSDGNLTIKEGTGKAYSFAGSYPNRQPTVALEYDTCPAPTAPTLYLFDGGTKAGALGGRAGADAMCQTAATSHSALGLSSVRALLSVSANDEIRDMPVSYGFPTGVPIKGPTGVKIADDWADLLDGSIDTTLSAAQTLGSDYSFYTGSSSNGALDSHNCTGWTAVNTQSDGHYGSSTVTNGNWLSTGNGTCGLAVVHVLCLGW